MLCLESRQWVYINTYIVNVVIKLGFSSLYTNLYTPTARTLDTALILYYLSSIVCRCAVLRVEGMATH